MSSLRKTENQIEKKHSWKNCIAEIVIIDNLIKGIQAINISVIELEIILDVLKKLNEKPRLGSIERSIRFKEFANTFIIKLIKQPKEFIFDIGDNINNGKNFKIKPVDTSHKGKYIAYCFELPFGIIYFSSLVVNEKMHIIFSGAKTSENEFASPLFLTMLILK